MNPAQCVAKHSGFQQSLHGVVHSGKHGITNEGKDDGIGMQRSDAPECGVLQIEVENGIHQLKSSGETNQHTHQSKDDGGDDEGFYNFIVVTKFFDFHIEWLRFSKNYYWPKIIATSLDGL